MEHHRSALEKMSSWNTASLQRSATSSSPCSIASRYVCDIPIHRRATRRAKQYIRQSAVGTTGSMTAHCLQRLL